MAVEFRVKHGNGIRVLKEAGLRDKPAYPLTWVLASVWIASIILLIGVFTGSLLTFGDATAIALVGVIAMAWVGVRMSRHEDASWLPAMVAIGYIAKIAASTARYVVLVGFYGGSGDAVGYHGAGSANVEIWRSFQIPNGFDTGTEFVDRITGLVYVPYVPTMLGGFFLFATIAFIGQLFMYAAFRRSHMPRRLKWYAMALFFIPAITYWPASLGKESLMFLGIGMAAYGSARFFDSGGLRPLLYLAPGLALAGAIRPHVAALMVGSLAVTLVVAKLRTNRTTLPSWQRWLAVLLVGVGSVLATTIAAREFNIDFAGDVETEVNDFVSNLEGNTGGGGSAVSGGAVRGIGDIPAATLRVLFRPLPFEAHNAPALASAIESAAILTVIIWRLPKILKNLRYLRRDSYVLMSSVMTAGFIVVFSPFLNLGLMARQRSQILPFLAVIVIQLGWDFIEDKKPKTANPSRWPMQRSLHR